MNVSANKQITSNVDAQFQSIEDPRLFSLRGVLMVAFVCSTWPEKSPTSIVQYGRLVQVGDGWNIEDICRVNYGKNDGFNIEKNWTPFESDGKLFFIYSTLPEQIILEVDGNTVKYEHTSKAPRWAWGEIRGGTTPLPYNGKLLRFFHSSLDFEMPPTQRRYFMGAAIMEAEPPFKTVAVSKSPICIGSELDDLNETERAACLQYKSKVVFPAGAIIHEDGWIVSCGLNDCESALLMVKEKDLKL